MAHNLLRINKEPILGLTSTTRRSKMHLVQGRKFVTVVFFFQFPDGARVAMHH